MAKIITQGRRVTQTRYLAFYEEIGFPGAGLAFPCDEAGNVLPGPPAQSIAEANDRTLYREPVIKDVVTSYWEPTVLGCDCGHAHIELTDPLTNTCDTCGRSYNCFGQKVYPHLAHEDY